MVNAQTNVGRICGACFKSKNSRGAGGDTSADGTSIKTGKKRQIRDQSYEFEGFSFSAAVKRALTSSRCQGSSLPLEKAVAAASLLDIQPMALHLRQSTTSKATTAFGLVTQDFVDDLRDVGIIFDTIHGPGTIVRASLQLPDADEGSASQSTQERVDGGRIDDTLKQAGFGKLVQATGNYDKLDNEVRDTLNMEFHEKPNLLACVADLMTHAIVSCKGTLIKILTAEAYSRHASLDSHGESQASTSSLPRHGHIFCGTIPAADGKGLKQKLTIASSTMNTLCTCSIVLDSSSRVEIGPGFSQRLDPKHCQLFLARPAMDKFKRLVSLSNDALPVSSARLSEIRQVTSAFHHFSTYSTWRRSFEAFRDVLHMPASIFTLCDLPSFAGYGSNATSAGKLSSQFLAVIARAYLYHGGLVTQAQLSNFLSLYDVVVKEGKNWKPLSVVVDRMREELHEKGAAVDVLQFAFFSSLSAVADVAGDSLSSANSKLASNIRERFIELYQEN
ncbi:hypothetical protein BC940DRAFT_321922 [Gongronella butleri]|nr:hypothetical protein BC940DRAFT_321922 [Gongronella butleri]